MIRASTAIALLQIVDKPEFILQAKITNFQLLPLNHAQNIPPASAASLATEVFTAFDTSVTSAGFASNAYLGSILTTSSPASNAFLASEVPPTSNTSVVFAIPSLLMLKYKKNKENKKISSR